MQSRNSVCFTDPQWTLTCSEELYDNQSYQHKNGNSFFILLMLVLCHLPIHLDSSQPSELVLGCKICKSSISSPKYPHKIYRPHILLLNWYQRLCSRKWAWHECHHSLPSTETLTIVGAITPLPL